jgi:hypothetical protein
MLKDSPFSDLLKSDWILEIAYAVHSSKSRSPFTLNTPLRTIKSQVIS